VRSNHSLSSNHKKKRILFVDNEPDITTMLKKALEHAGFSIDVFNDPLLALKSFKPKLYDLVILDVMMRLTIKDFQRLVQSEQSGLGDNQILAKRQINHIIGLPKKDSQEKPLFDYEKMLYKALIDPIYLNCIPTIISLTHLKP
jgi:CheY-like chemotaxis protein